MYFNPRKYFYERRLEMKLGIIGGAGLLGSTTAFRVALLGIVDEIVLIDIKENMVKSHVMDLEQAISEYNQTRITAGKWSDLKDCNIVLLSASVPETNVKSRVEYLGDNLKIIQSICGYIKEYCPDAVLINATNPVDVINLAIQRLTGAKRNQIVGFSRNDTLRMRWAIAKVLGVNTADVSAICIGEHGEKQVPLFSRVFVKGEARELTEDEKIKVLFETSNWFANYQSLKSGRTSGWTSALGLAKLIQCIVEDSDEILPCSVILEGEYSFNGISLGVPVKLGYRGVKQIVEYPLHEKELEALKEAAEKIRQLSEEYIK